MVNCMVKHVNFKEMQVNYTSGVLIEHPSAREKNRTT